MIGVFIALDLFVFYVFWEVMLIPMYFLIGVWGGANRLYAAIKFFIYTFAGSLLMLVAILAIVWHRAHATGTITFAYDELVTYTGASTLDGMKPWLFLAFFLAFAIKVPLFRSTPGSPTPTSRPRPRPPSCWPRCCSRWGPTASSGSPSRSSPRRRSPRSPRRWWWPSR